MLARLVRFAIRISAFVVKEIIQVVRQPKLVLILILGPFAILLIFGLGFRNEPTFFRTLFVVPDEGQTAEQVEEYAANLHPQLEYMGMTYSFEEASFRLRQGDVDLLAVVPENAYEQILNSERAQFHLYYREIDPFEVDWINFFAGLFVQDANRRVLREVIAQQQQGASNLDEDLAEAERAAREVRTALAEQDALTARLRKAELDRKLDDIQMSVEASLLLLSGVRSSLSPGATARAEEARETLRDVRELSETLEEVDPTQEDYSDEIERAERLEERIVELRGFLGEFESIAPEVLVEPFGVTTERLGQPLPSVPDFLTAGVIALLLQHISVTIAGLSLVREEQVGATELFRVSPVSASEMLLGKYVSYAIFVAILTAGLTALVYYVLRVPMYGDWWHYAGVVAVLVFSSLSIGFVISVAAETDTQAVQYTMIVLLAAVFFSGFFMSLRMLTAGVRAVSWTMPTTYGMILLRDIMLRGVSPSPSRLLPMLGIGIVLFAVAWLALRRRMATQ